ncbi:hypothetical protein GO755_32860 [Spirosoma sp. HMF4905]|uniref:Uncharacterized protein n=1 Tax=Spirosoma arboris TaxID=2682092 RepID=A0A7K1SMN2_9BACT|nr:hypothetical protein [Spirosoma arboris]MVM34866.1 hypothetical protein [Spirosoma arboris]
MFPDANTIWSIALAGVSDTDISSYLSDYGLTPTAPSDAKLTADVTTAKATATATGNTKLANTLDFILKYGDKALTILTKNGIIKTNSLAGAGYSLDLSTLSTDTTSSAPDASSRVFNIDFTDPKVLIITFLLVMILFYFLFFNPSTKHAKR